MSVARVVGFVLSLVMVACNLERKRKAKKTLRYVSSQRKQSQVREYVRDVVTRARGERSSVGGPVKGPPNEILPGVREVKLFVSSAKQRRIIKRELKTLGLDVHVVFLPAKLASAVAERTTSSVGDNVRPVSRFAAERAEALRIMMQSEASEEDNVTQENFLASLNGQPI